MGYCRVSNRSVLTHVSTQHTVNNTLDVYVTQDKTNSDKCALITDVNLFIYQHKNALSVENLSLLMDSDQPPDRHDSSDGGQTGAAAHEERVHVPGGLPPLGDGPHHQGLTTVAVCRIDII